MNQQTKFTYPQVFRRLVFPFPVVTPPPLPINRSVNDHSFYWYVQTTNIEMFSAFINAFSSRFRVSDNCLDQHGRLSRSHSGKEYQLCSPMLNSLTLKISHYFTISDPGKGLPSFESLIQALSKNHTKGVG